MIGLKMPPNTEQAGQLRSYLLSLVSELQYALNTLESENKNLRAEINKLKKEGKNG